MSVVARGNDTGPAAHRAADPPDPTSSFATKLDWLINEVHPRGRGPYTMEEIADGVAAVGGPEFSPAYYSHLRRGRKKNPLFDLVVGLAAFFEVPMSYFASMSDSGREVASSLTAAPQMQALVSKLLRIQHSDDIAAVTAVVDSFLRRDPAAGDE